ncbi:hypothetical protein [Lagierella massiliensis]|uniref:hypothetical protein n=1 Tax=Lagierella massiliensis TaxID=1689303 RepID=UPI0006D81922|nr:hypothetical protein [Lagierella massiliensis]
MKTIRISDLEADLFIGDYVDRKVKIFMKEKSIIEGIIEYYTHDEEPFINYLAIKDRFELIEFNEIEKIELLD